MPARTLLKKLKGALGEHIGQAWVPRPHRAFFTVKREELHDVVEALVKRFDIQHLSTITGVDTGEEIELLYHFWDHDVCFTVKITLPHHQPRIKTLTDIVPGALFYEREVHDLLGVEFEEHPDLSPLVLPEGWEDGHPLLKDWSPPEEN